MSMLNKVDSMTLTIDDVDFVFQVHHCGDGETMVWHQGESESRVWSAEIGLKFSGGEHVSRTWDDQDELYVTVGFFSGELPGICHFA